MHRRKGFSEQRGIARLAAVAWLVSGCLAPPIPPPRAAGPAAPGTAATSAPITYPYGLALEADGGLYLAEYGNHRILYVGTR